MQTYPLKALWLLCAALLLTACAASVQPQSTKQAIWASTQYAIATVDTANRLHERGLLDDRTHGMVLDQIDSAAQALGDARSLMEAGKPLEAEDQLQISRDILEGVQRTLREAQNE